MKLSAPSQVVWIIAVVLGIAGILASMGVVARARRVCLLAGGGRMGTPGDRDADAQHVVCAAWTTVLVNAGTAWSSNIPKVSPPRLAGHPVKAGRARDTPRSLPETGCVGPADPSLTTSARRFTQ